MEDAEPIRGSGTLTLQPNAWNEGRLVWSEDSVQFWVNAELVCTCPSKQAIGNTFGFAHNSRHEHLAIRNVELTGAWKNRDPSQLETTGFEWSQNIGPQRRALLIEEARWLTEFLEPSDE